MIPVVRLPTPDVLEQRGEAWTTELCEGRTNYYQALRAFETGDRKEKPAYPKAKKSRYAHAEITTRLKEMIGPKCIYCEKGDEYLHVEHFRPQSIYPHLAYNWDNLLLACAPCNSGWKRDTFPLKDGSQPMEDSNAPCSRDGEDANMLINPCVDKPEEHFYFEDERLVCLDDRAMRTRDVCGLNREELRDRRRKWLVLIEAAALAFLFAEQQGHIEKRNAFAIRLRSCLHYTAPFVAMTRSKLRSLGINMDAL